MRTTVDLPDALLCELKAKAAMEGTTLKPLMLVLVERGLRDSARPAPARGKRSRLPTLDLKQPLAIRSFSNARLFESIDE